MTRCVVTCTLLLTLCASLVIAQPPAAQGTVPAIGWADIIDVSEVWDGPTVTVTFVTTRAWGTVIGWHRNAGETTFNTETGELTGHFTAESLEFDGTSISGTYTGKVQQIPGTTVTMNTLFVTWTEGTGTGPLEGASGKVEVRTVEDESGGPFGVGAGHYEYHGFFVLP